MGPEPYEDDLERGLAAAFGPPSTRSSVLRALAALTGAEPADLGRAEVGEDDEGRYRVLGEIARGGMGVVMRTRDVEIGRDVAMKVLRPELSREPTALRRFVEEAQIGGQLQHPGIVPVYEMGLRADDQAFFTMKLIQGRTLSALLREREDPSVGRRRFLSVFESVCQTVAYAHARGVIHRDLKPANVMVGSFGEVQVVDWGFAKVLGSPEPRREPRAKPTPKAEARVRTVRSGSTEGQSQVGSAMGTPAYMPPEQAYGDGERMDERSDVFALGATLCEILTGEPPYRKQDGNQLVQAAKHRVTGACERLAACGADPELVALAVRCLGTFEERPRDAGEVAQGVGAYLTSVEERARRAEVRAAQETVRAAEERKRRKLTAALAAAVLLLVVGGGGGYALVERARLGRVQANTVAAGRDLQEALRLEERAREGRRVEDWEPAVLAARQANDHSSSAEIDGDVAAEAAGALERIEQARAEAHARATREARDQAMAARVRAAGEVMGHGLHFEEMDREYAAAFAEYGIDPFALEPEEAARRARESAITGDLCAALDDWAVNLQMSGAAGGQRAERLLDVAARADPDPWRAAVRRAGAAGDEAELETLRAAADIEKLDAPSVLLMERSLAATVNREAAIDWLRRAQPHHPGDFWLHLRLGCHLHNEGAGDSREAVGFLRVALAVRPESVEARHYLGLAHQDLGEHEVALALWDQALALKPDYHHLHVHVFESEKALGRLDEALARARRDIADDPQSAPAYWRLGSLLRMRAQFPAALEAFERATEIDPDFAGGWGARGTHSW